MMQNLLNELIGPDIGLDSKISDLKGQWDYINLILSCEEIYGFLLEYDEMVFFEQKDLSFGEIEEFIVFIKTGVASERTRRTIADNIKELKGMREIYMDYIADNRNARIIDLLKKCGF